MPDKVEKKAGEEKEADVKVARHRSPNYPSFGLRKAVELATLLEGRYRRSPVPIHLAHPLWGYKEHSGAGNQAVAALKAFGLINVTGEGKTRQIQLHEDGQHIARNGPSTDTLLKAAALKPAIYLELWEKYRVDGLPDDSLMKHYLEWDRKEGTFNPDVVDGFIADFKDTLAFAKLSNRDIIDPADVGNDKKTEVPKIGDFIQWTSQGVDQFQEPHRIVGVSEDGLYVFVEGTTTGVPMSQTTKEKPPSNLDLAPPLNPHFKGDNPAGVARVERRTLSEGPVVIQWPQALSAESVEDLEYWIEGLLRQARREAGVKQKNS